MYSSALRDVLCRRKLLHILQLWICPRSKLFERSAESTVEWQGDPHGIDRTSRKQARRAHAVRSSDRFGQPVRRRAMGAILLLRDAHNPRLLPLLLVDR